MLGKQTNLLVASWLMKQYFTSILNSHRFFSPVDPETIFTISTSCPSIKMFVSLPYSATAAQHMFKINAMSVCVLQKM
ncbi:hypothetical protein VNO78_20501 [Psophocarpus tetragonolobus]|uniref:Uncharacterized protein n=1 Tax=Psophocarpus tetragonolobus TaxID=3891 RepID=A0AAN9S9I4_PSOTE